MYSIINSMLRFLLAASPTVTATEAAGLSSTWPSKGGLLSIRQDCLTLAENISHWEMEESRVLHVVTGLRDSIQMLNELLEVLGYTHQGREAEIVENRLVEMDMYIGQR